VHSSPSATAVRKNAIEGLFSSPTPAATPNTSHHRCCDSPRSSSSNASAHVIQKTGSQQFMDRNPSTPMYCGHTSTPIIASACAPRRPPSAHVSTPPRKIVSAPATAARTRIPNTESPNNSSLTLACTATMGPWSTNPHARWCPQAR